jgi:hypothetical protein
VDVVRAAVRNPDAEALIGADRLGRDVEHLKTRLERVRAMGGAFASVGFSADVGYLLARIEAGAALSSYVH